MRTGKLTCLLSLGVWGLFAQVGRASLTGTITDPAGAVVSAAPIEAKNLDTAAIYRAASTAAGNYTTVSGEVHNAHS